jgi:hypothetical protein
VVASSWSLANAIQSSDQLATTEVNIGGGKRWQLKVELVEFAGFLWLLITTKGSCRLIRNDGVGGSSPSCGTNKINGLADFENSRKSLVTRQLQILETLHLGRSDAVAQRQSSSSLALNHPNYKSYVPYSWLIEPRALNWDAHASPI